MRSPTGSVDGVTRSVFVAAAEGASVKSIVALGLVDLLTRQVDRVGVFRPVTSSPDADVVVDLLLAHPGVDQDRATAIGVTYPQVHANQNQARATIVRRFAHLQQHYDAIVILGSDFVDVATPGELTFNARVAADLGSPVVLVVSGKGRRPEQTRAVALVAMGELTDSHAQPVAIIANRVDPADLAATAAELAAATTLPTGVIPEVPLLVAPTVRQLLEATDARMLRGDPDWLDRESGGFLVAAMSLPNVLTRLRAGTTVIAPGDRSDLLPGLVLAHQAGTFGHLSAIVLTGGYTPPEPVQALIDGLGQDLPIAVSGMDTFPTAAAMANVRGRLTAESSLKVQTALRTFSESVDGPALLRALDVPPSDVVTPLMFANRLMERARRQRRHLVLPEGTDERILRAAASVLRQGIADLTLLGDENAIRQAAAAHGLDITAATIVDPGGVPVIEAGTRMVQDGLADGMVAGAAHTTAETIRPAFSIIRTAPGVSVISSAFLMCLADRVLVYSDCAVVPDPTAEELADIAISAAATATLFDIEPRIAMLSYSTGTSGTGSDVDKVRTATDLVRQRRPDLLLDGPLQYDAAVDPATARTKAPHSPIGGNATVLVFPDLNTGNNTYKAVQRSAGAVAIGPVLQGLAKPVNDLSRGATVDDIVNTIAITAIQAQQ